MKAARSLQPNASTRPASSARQPARSSCVIEWSCCWSLHHWMREMMFVGSYSIVPSCVRYNGVATRITVLETGGTHYQVNPSICGGKTPASTPRLALPCLHVDKSHTPEGLIGNSDETCPEVGMLTLGVMRKLGGSPAGESDSPIEKRSESRTYRFNPL